jgi:hypothetical protein
MTTTERPPAVANAFDALAKDEDPVGRTYSPNALLTLRWLAFRPGSSVAVLAGVHERKVHKVQATLVRLRTLGLATGTTGGRGTDGGRWWLTEHGRELVALIDERGIV